MAGTTVGKRTIFAAATALFCFGQICLAAPVAKAEHILDLIPADAWGFLVLPDVQQCSRKVDHYAMQVGMEPPNLAKQLSSKVGVDLTGGPAAVVILNFQVYGQQPYLVIFSSSDYAKLSATLKAEPTEKPGVVKVRLPGDEVGHMTRKDGFVMLAPSEMILQTATTSKYSAGKAWSAAQRQQLFKHDAFCRVNLQAVVPAVKPYLMLVGAFAGAGMTGMPPMGVPGMPPGGQETAPGQGGTAADQAAQARMMQSLMASINALVTLLDQLRNLDLAADIQDKGLRFGADLSFKPGSEYAQRLAAQKATDQPLLTGLPGEDFLLAWGLNWVSPQPTQFELPMMDASPIADPELKEKLKQLNIEKQKLTTGFKGVVGVNPTAQPGQGLMRIQTVLLTTDAKRSLQISRELIELQPAVPLMATAGQPGQQIQMQYLPAAEKIGDVAVDHLIVDMAPITNMLQSQAGGQAQQAIAAMKLFFGSQQDKLTIRMAALDAKAVGVDVAGSTASMRELIDSYRKNSPTLASLPTVKATAANLPKSRIGEAYLNLGNVMQMLPAMAGALGEDASKLPPALTAREAWPIIGLSISTTGDAIHIENFVPTELIAKIKSIATTSTKAVPTTQPAPPNK